MDVPAHRQSPATLCHGSVYRLVRMRLKRRLALPTLLLTGRCICTMLPEAADHKALAATFVPLSRAAICDAVAVAPLASKAVGARMAGSLSMRNAHIAMCISRAAHCSLRSSRYTSQRAITPSRPPDASMPVSALNATAATARLWCFRTASGFARRA